MLALNSIDITILDPNYIFMELSDNDILESDKYGFKFNQQDYFITSTFVLFDTTRIKVSCMSCGSENNHILVRRDTDQVSILDSLYRPQTFMDYPWVLL